MNEIKEENVKAVTVPIVPENSALMTNEKFYPKPQVLLKDAETSAQTKQKFEQLLRRYDDIISKHSSDTGRTPLETMTIDIKPSRKQTVQYCFEKSGLPQTRAERSIGFRSYREEYVPICSSNNSSQSKMQTRGTTKRAKTFSNRLPKIKSTIDYG